MSALQYEISKMEQNSQTETAMKAIKMFFNKKKCTDTITDVTKGTNGSETVIKPYKKRFWMLFLFSTLSMLCGMVCPQFATMANVTMCFYEVSVKAVIWTCLIFMVVYIVFVFPVSWLMDKMGLRKAVIIGSMLNTVALAVQFASFTPQSFTFVMLSSFFGSLSNVFVLAVPPSLASVWFPSEEVSRACAMGVVGNQLGVALGFLVPPLLISTDCTDPNLIADGKRTYAIFFTSLNAIVLILTVSTFQDKPLHPPSRAQANKKDLKESYIQSALTMMRNVDFLLLLVMYGFVVGAYFATATILNNLMIPFFPDANVAIGWMGLLVIAAGLVGSVISGYILDYTHRFKEISISVCLLSFISYVIFSCLLPMQTLWIQFVTIGILGFFLTSFLPIGFEYGIEVTYPESEITSAGLLNSSAMIFGLILTEISSSVLMNHGPTYSNIVLSVSCLASAVTSCFLTKDYKRNKKNKEVLFTTKL